MRATGAVTGTIIVLGGRATVDVGAKITGRNLGCEQPVALSRSSDNTIRLSPPGRSLSSIKSAIGVSAGPYRISPLLGVGQYNRVEGLPGKFGVNVSRPVFETDSVRANVYGIARTASDPSGSRPAIGWHASALFAHNGELPFTVIVGGGSTVQSTQDQPFSPVESGLIAFLARDDYNDWYLNRGVNVAASVRVTPELTLSGILDWSHQTTVLAVDAFSLLNSDQPWRPNPLIDDGVYHTQTVRVVWDARNEREHPVLSWYAAFQLQHVASNDLTPVSTIPVTIRDPLPTTNYGSTSADIDLRAYLRLDPDQRINFRVMGGGYLAGDPLTIQNRHAVGSADPLIGYDFRAINCDRRRKVDPALPALCDRSAAVQVAYHRALAIDLTTRIDGYNIGIRKPDLVLFGDGASAWLAGDTPGRVPVGNIQAIREWRSDVGVGITSGPFGLYVAKALADASPVRFTLLLSPRF